MGKARHWGVHISMAGGAALASAAGGGSVRVWLRPQADYGLALAERKHGAEMRRTVRAA